MLFNATYHIYTMKYNLPSVGSYSQMNRLVRKRTTRAGGTKSLQVRCRNHQLAQFIKFYQLFFFFFFFMNAHIAALLNCVWSSALLMGAIKTFSLFVAHKHLVVEDITALIIYPCNNVGRRIPRGFQW